MLGTSTRADAPTSEHLTPARRLSVSPVTGAVTVVAVLAVGWVVRDLAGPSVITWLVRGLIAATAASAAFVGLRRHHAAVAREHDVATRETELSTQRELLVQTVSHEFRTPLAIIQGVTETLLERRGLPENKVRALLYSMRNASHRLTDLTGVVLAVVEPLGRENQDIIRIEDLVRDVARELDRLGGATRIQVGVGDDATALVSNPHRMRLILRAILENSLRFSPAEEPVEVRTSRDGITFATRVSDRGPGMTAELASRAFEPLVQGDASTTRAHGGLGIGLFAARQATVQLGGDIELVNRGDGVDVVIRLPQRRDSDQRLERRPDQQVGA